MLCSVCCIGVLLSWLNIQVVEYHLFENLMRGDRFRANSKIRCSFTERVASGVHENISRRLIELAAVKKYSHQRVALPLFFPPSKEALQNPATATW